MEPDNQYRLILHQYTGTQKPITGNAAKAENLRKRKTTKRPDWNDLMKEIEAYRYSHSALNKVHTNDRSMPILPKNKRGGQVSS
jgi:hypothetical protein